jgi:hypothetical protein
LFPITNSMQQILPFARNTAGKFLNSCFTMLFTDRFFRQGDQSPQSGRVRCYCKPSWEGMLDTAPYISDVYWLCVTVQVLPRLSFCASMQASTSGLISPSAVWSPLC